MVRRCLDSNLAKHHDACVRTTLTLDPDLVRELKKIAQSSEESFKGVVNDAIRRGLQQGSKSAPPLPRFVVQPKACGFRGGIDPSRLNQLVDDLEVEDFQRELHASRR